MRACRLFKLIRWIAGSAKSDEYIGFSRSVSTFGLAQVLKQSTPLGHYTLHMSSITLTLMKACHIVAVTSNIFPLFFFLSLALNAGVGISDFNLCNCLTDFWIPTSCKSSKQHTMGHEDKITKGFVHLC